MAYPYRFYQDISIRATRSGNSKILYSWNNEPSGGAYEVYYVRFYLTSTKPSDIPSKAKSVVSSPYDDMYDFDDVTKTDLTASVASGDLYVIETTKVGYTPVAVIVYRNPSSSTGWSYTTAYPNYQTESYIGTSQAPSISYNSSNGQITIGTAMTGQRIIEFRRTDVPYGGDTGISDETTLNEMLLTSLVNTEANPATVGYYRLASGPKLNRWVAGAYTVGVNFVTSTNQARISAAIDNAISQVNSVMREFGISFVRAGTSGDITVTVDAEDSLWPGQSQTGYIYGGTWETYKNANGQITGAAIKLANDFQEYAYFCSYETAAFEELLQCMGAGYDQTEYAGLTIHTDFNYYNKQSSMYERDANILRLLYSSEIATGDNYYDVCKKLNIPLGCYTTENYTLADAEEIFNVYNFCELDATYQMRAFIVDGTGKISGTSNWITVQIPPYSNNDTILNVEAKYTSYGNVSYIGLAWEILVGGTPGTSQTLRVRWQVTGYGITEQTKTYTAGEVVKDSYLYAIYNPTRGLTYNISFYTADYETYRARSGNYYLSYFVPQIDLWDWGISNGSATAAQTLKAYHTLCDPVDAGTYLPASGNFSHLVWNDIVDKAAEVVNLKGLTWNNHSGLGVNGCKAVSGSTLSASKYNEVRFNIGAIQATGISDKAKNDRLYGTYIKTLTNTMNAIIESA